MILTDEEIKKQFISIGYQIEDVYDLVNTNKDYSDAIPLLIDFLKKDIVNKSTQEGVIRALAIKEAKGKAGKSLLELYKRIDLTSEGMIGWAIGNTIFVVATEDEVEEIINIASNKNNGISRQMFILTLGKFKKELTENILIELLKDSEVAAHAIKALQMIGSSKCFNEVEKLLDSKNPLIRKNAKKFLKK